MGYRILAVTLTLLLFLCNISLNAVPQSDENEYDAITVLDIMANTNLLNLKAKSYILMENTTGKIIMESNCHEKRPIASVTKIMTLLLVFEAVKSGKISFHDQVVISESSFRMGGSQVYLEPKEEFSVHELLKAVAINSANDASVALAEKVSGSEEAFVASMNQKAKELGMVNTNFLDSSGLTDEGHYSTAYDIAVMSRELLLKHPQITEYTSIWHDTFRDGTFALNNTNKLIRFYDGANGLKTGFTSKAGFCLSATAKRGNMGLIAVVLGEPDSNTRFAEARKLLDYGFTNYELNPINKEGDIAGEIFVKNGIKKSLSVVFPYNVDLLVLKGEKDKIHKKIVLYEELDAPINGGKKTGEVIFEVDGREIERVELVASETVERATFIGIYREMIIGLLKLGK